MAKQHSVLCLLMAFFAFALPVLAVVDKWTPADFNWTSLKTGSPDTWKGLYHNLSDPSVGVSKEVMAMGQVRTTETGDSALVIPFAMGVAWQVFNLALTGIGLTSTIKGCLQNQGDPTNILFCVNGLIATIIGVGGIASAAKNLAQSRGFLGVAANAWDNSGLESIALTVFNKRGIDDGNMTAQKAHNFFVHQALSSLSVGEVDFVGYAPDNHKLARRSSAEHPFAPMFRFKHKRFGGMEVTSRDTGDNGMHFTISYEGHPTHHASKEKRDEFYEHERLSSNLMEARFDSEASNADPQSISFDGEGAFDQIESTLECYTNANGNSWPSGNVLSAQLYDQANEATFGFATVGMFADDSVNSGLEDYEPSGQPITGGQDC